MGNFNCCIFPVPKYNKMLAQLAYNNKKLIFIPKKQQNNSKIIDYIPCVFMPSELGRFSSNFLLFFHGNAEDIFLASTMAEPLRLKLNINVIIMEYPSYSIYSYQKIDTNILLENTLIVYDSIKEYFNVNDENIFIYGRSIGSSPAIYVAGKRKPKALILISSFKSLKSIVYHKICCLNCLLKERFRSIDFIKGVSCPIIMIHGKADPLIKWTETLDLKNDCESRGIYVESNFPENMTHNDFNYKEDILEPIYNFLINNKLLDIENVGKCENYDESIFKIPNETIKKAIYSQSE